MRDTPILKVEVNSKNPTLIKTVKLSFFKKVGCVFVVIFLFWVAFISNGNFDVENIQFESPEVRQFCLKFYWIINGIFLVLVTFSLSFFLLKKFNFI